MSQEEEGGAFIDTSAAREKPTPPQTPSKEKKRDGLYIIIILMLLLAGGFLAWKISDKNEQINVCGDERDELTLELESLNEMLYEQGVEMGEDVKENLQNMMAMYDKMEMNNAGMSDSIQAQKDKIQTLMADLEDAKGDRSHYASKARKLQEETEVLRSIMKDYIRTIDSLNYANGVLTESLATTLSDLETTQSNLNVVTEERNNLNDKVSKGSKLVAFGILSTGIKEKSSGSYKETDRASRATHIRACFTVGENTIANAGNKVIYMRIVAPTGTILNSSTANTFKNEGGQSLIYSDKKTIDYQNQATDVCIFYELTEEAPKGNYKAQLYCEGVMIGSDDFVLK